MLPLLLLLLLSKANTLSNLKFFGIFGLYKSGLKFSDLDDVKTLVTSFFQLDNGLLYELRLSVAIPRERLQ